MLHTLNDIPCVVTHPEHGLVCDTMTLDELAKAILWDNQTVDETVKVHITVNGDVWQCVGSLKHIAELVCSLNHCVAHVDVWMSSWTSEEIVEDADAWVAADFSDILIV